MKNRAKALLGSAAAAVAAVALLPTTAHAVSQPGVATVCNWSDSNAMSVFPYRGGFSSPIISPNTCWTYSGLVGRSSDEVVGYRQVNGIFHAVAYQYFNDADGVNFVF